ncbi:MAG: hypothetical protein Q4C75_00420 [Bergeyella zoohelcum]|nr:hypothetical protein [Bergeyella zoohelcum]
METDKNIHLTEDEKLLIYNAMIQIVEWQSESFTKEQLKTAETIIYKLTGKK